MTTNCDLCPHLTSSSVEEIHNNLMGAAEKLSKLLIIKEWQGWGWVMKLH